ncbi:MULTISPECIES: DNA helicase RecQ [unclassified Clostridioides]|uniref:DNA helicase RecQ n=1 Tax=unclassified Clostridioides TaxID=2635829 RepID=UPI001D0C92A3|nr:DNA helicase RecQ [Clostridioides sp. ES-S-0001-02]MCC0639993.1 DNA helicase RecQ [Clostridioides sp. ES-S-0049-03]MCC0653751.1 DNA helicase RecQ [Clostridioides sp. ES-S-0001-03]MCC0655430.1 DNA helicase RecQ [Clostridioides sp. ES-S-0123-01]MCC0670729.1 DNA helicase RecQ [Clostridioides sp. ES-S-0145-01]MCC0674787.1 DNA helicase RecQ [Clostridioides sp. ES-W-0018-02]MCC0710398.1 DNA helicase RecQ [Clostridioides sp. ES-W-0017-02]UDN56850.1 DNA helicase RecQ [Clostridioides sp. ES-S-0010
MNKKPLEILSKYYGYTSFRKGQESIINSILNKKDVLAIMPTGGGKSICYQLPALILDGMTVVISPLISLMKDQVDALKAMGINAAFINSSLGNKEFNEILSNIRKNTYKILYIAPERLDTQEFLELINNNDISQIAIDEAHCVSQWGHDFRLSYRRISTFINSLSKRPIVTAFTATASEEVRADIINLLCLESPDCYITGFDRENLAINIVKSSSKNKYILDYIQNHKNESGIIYTATRKEVENIYNGLAKRNISVSKYHAGLSKNERNKNQEDFINDNIDIMIATNAFGMGIDKPNIRWVIHYNMPQSVENYYQEIGRAGRDGEKSECILLFSPGDVHIQKYLIDIGVENPERKLFQHKKLQHMIDLVYSNSCYRRTILNYFGENYIENCNNCSNCLVEGEIVDKTIDAQKVISCVARMKRSYGVTTIVDVLRGSKNKKILQLGLDTLSTYNIMRDYSSEDLKNFINTLVSHGFLDLVETLGSGNRGSYPTIRLNDMSMKVLKGEVKVEFKEIVMTKSLEIEDELYSALRELRHLIASEERIAPYMVFGDGTLRAMSSSYPVNKEEMLNISGVGEIKYQKYGEDFETLIKEYVEKNNIDKKDKEKNVDLMNVNSEFLEVNTDKALYERLINIREEYAKKEKLLPYMILTNKALKEISGRYPIDKEQLKDISGIGEVKIEKYGASILDEVKHYVKENSIDVTWEKKKKRKLILDGESRKNNEIALDLLNQGKDIQSVSQEIEVSLSTVIGYVYDYLKDGQSISFTLDLENFYSEDERKMILEVCEEVGYENLNNIKRKLPDSIKYENIRAVILKSYLENSKKGASLE